MIEIKQVTKCFGDLKAVDGISATIDDNHVFGLIGTNGAGKSTLMRMIAGVLKQDEGQILVDGENVYDCVSAKKKIFFISDDQFFSPSGNPEDMRRTYETFYPDFEVQKWKEMMERFGLDSKRKISTFSKGMRKQLSIINGICANTKYLLCDETFDGLDPVMRQAVKSLFVKEMDERGLTPVIASHNLRELEDICEYVGLLHRGGILFEKDIEDMKLNVHKLQCVFKEKKLPAGITEQLDILTQDNRGSLFTVTVRGNRQQIIEIMEAADPVFYELLPLSLEEIFITETEVKGYDIKKILL